jgi:hypothetical protein
MLVVIGLRMAHVETDEKSTTAGPILNLLCSDVDADVENKTCGWNLLKPIMFMCSD